MKYSISILGITIFFPFLGFFSTLVGLATDFKHWRIYIFSLAWSIAIMAYCFHPTVESDLVRYFDYLNILQYSSFLDGMNSAIQGNENLYFFSFISWIIAQMGDYHLLPALSTFFVYYIGFYVTYKTGEVLEIKKGLIFKYLIFMLLMLSFFSIVNNIRNVLAFAIIGLAIYRDLFLGKKGICTLLLYALPCFIHISAILFVFIRLLLRFSYSNKLKLGLLIVIVFVPNILLYFSDKVGGVAGANIITQMLYDFINKGNDYYTRVDAGWAEVAAKSISVRMEKFVYSIYSILALIQVFIVLKKDQKKILNSTENEKHGRSQFLDFYYILCLLIIASLPMVMPEYWRFATMAVLFGSISTFAAFKSNSSLYIKSIEWLMLLLAVVHFLLWLRSMLNYSDFPQMIAMSVYCNPFTIMLSNLLNLNMF